MSYQALRVTAELMAPVILDRRQPLDGILAATRIEDPELRRRDREFRRFKRNVERFGYENAVAWWKQHGWEVPEDCHFLPLAVFGHGHEHGLWVYCSSFAILDEYERGLTHFHKRLDWELAGQWVEPSHKRIQTGKGEFKNQRVPLMYQAVNTVTWYVKGNYNEIVETLNQTYELFKKRNRGYGQVRSWQVEQIEHDRSVFSEDGEIMRPVPARLLESMGIEGNFVYEYTTYRPPYWQPRYATRCAVGGKINEK
ncbi:MAG: hypothetical protein D6706_18455 [Chloroflexi bacterium]|nr:MAG: hypothetical protein D6706_18455 [Chloroflexota bacterium]